MLSDGVIFLHVNTHTGRKNKPSRIAEKVQVERLEPPHTNLAPKLSSKHLSGTRFSSNSDEKTAAENCRRDFCQSGLNQLFLVQINAEIDLVIMWKSDRQFPFCLVFLNTQFSLGTFTFRFEATGGLYWVCLPNFEPWSDHEDDTRVASPLSKLPRQASGRTFDLNRFNVFHIRLQGHSSTESGSSLPPSGPEVKSVPPNCNGPPSRF
ncbi:hypothetical protein AVEN_20501-1 [Araneus ventricosus]|uniref:Uncharacterized protein n=1 Tax=Araneus ventricosus TaxID=182803 RepID=A0A4Y2HXF1_ARAVE|nr:hypothetical protein AVEN_20501-1 [Araneus ventricosus]